MERRLLIQIRHLADLICMEIHSKLVALYEREADSYSEVKNWRRQFTMARKCIEDPRQTRQLQDFSCHFRIEKDLEDLLPASVRTIAEATGYIPSSIFFVLSEVMRLQCRHWRFLPTYSIMIIRLSGFNRPFCLSFDFAAARSWSEC
jgi:hypothetical protein